MELLLNRHALPEQLQIQRAVQRLTGALRLPQRFAQTFEDFVCCRVGVIKLCGELRMNFANAVRLIDVELFLNREMKSEVQKRIDVARFGSPIGADERGWVVKHAVIFRMQADDRCGLFFERRERIAALKLSPGVDEKLPCLVAVWIEHDELNSFHFVAPAKAGA